jgi:hypothetical protein
VFGVPSRCCFDSKRVVALIPSVLPSADVDATNSNNYSDSIDVTIEFITHPSHAKSRANFGNDGEWNGK